MKNTKEITMILTEVGLNRFKRIPTFNRLLHSNQVNDLVVGDNKLTVNHYIYSELKRMQDFTNITIISQE